MQEHESLPRKSSPREFIRTMISKDEDAFKLASRLIGYGLTLGQIDMPIGELNPGARARLLLAVFSIRNVNTLILDEPTNHLDSEAVDELIASVNVFKGTVVVVSHDRHFLEAIKVSRAYRLSEKGLEEVQE